MSARGESDQLTYDIRKRAEIRARGELVELLDSQSLTPFL